MRILIVNTSSPEKIGGVENSIRKISEELINLGHEVKILVLGNDNKKTIKKVNNVEVIEIPVKNKKLPCLQYMEIRRSLKIFFPNIKKEYQPDFIISRNVIMSDGIISLNTKSKILQIYATTAEMNAKGLYVNTDGSSLKRRLILRILYFFDYYSYKRSENRVLDNSLGIVFSKLMKEKLNGDKLRKNRQLIHQIHPGVDVDFFNNNLERFSESETKKINDLGNYVLLVGRLAIAKNFQLMIRALKHVEADTNLVIVGDGPEEIRLKELAEECEVSHRVKFLGRQSRLLPLIYSKAKVFVLPTTVESFGQVYLESLACGTPCVGFGNNSKFDTATSEIIDNSCGIVIEFESELANGINRILRLNSEEYSRMSKNCLELTNTRYSWLKFTQEIMRLVK